MHALILHQFLNHTITWSHELKMHAVWWSDELILHPIEYRMSICAVFQNTRRSEVISSKVNWMLKSNKSVFVTNFAFTLFSLLGGRVGDSGGGFKQTITGGRWNIYRPRWEKWSVQNVRRKGGNKNQKLVRSF